MGLPTIGNPLFTAVPTDARALAPASLMVGTSDARIAVAGGCTLWVDPILQAIPGLTDLTRVMRVALPIPNDPNLLGRQTYYTAAVCDGAAPGGVVYSQGLHTLVGR